MRRGKNMPEDNKLMEGGLLDERLIQLTTENEQLKNKLAISEKEKESLQVDYANKLALAKVEFENKELALRREITQLRNALELRKSKDEAFERAKGKKKGSVNQIWEEVLGGDGGQL